jgi:glycosyltransferase involved in cell wall biosynthesis
MPDTALAVSVVLPVKDAPEDYLIAAVSSVLAQRPGQLELLVIETPSRRCARATLERLADCRVHHHLLPAAATMVDQLNYGLQRSRAALVARMDADDICHSERLCTQLDFLQANPDVDVVGTQIELIGEDGTTIGRRRFPTEHGTIVAALRRKNPISHPSVCFRREVVLGAGGYQHPERPAQDYDLWCRLALRGARFANLDQALLRYRLHPRSVKVRRLRETLGATIAIKESYFRGRFGLVDRLRLQAEKTALHLPEPLVYGLFRLVEYGVRPVRRGTAP